ncbi:hypothetical protein BaRGS_00014455, partial [Batillaria attramentaria]
SALFLSSFPTPVTSLDNACDAIRLISYWALQTVTEPGGGPQNYTRWGSQTAVVACCVVDPTTLNRVTNGSCSRLVDINTVGHTAGLMFDVHDDFTQHSGSDTPVFRHRLVCAPGMRKSGCYETGSDREYSARSVILPLRRVAVQTLACASDDLIGRGY